MDTFYRTKKKFGQHFLHERKYIDDILNAADIKKEESVLEVGPGLGALTDHLLAGADRVEVMELDRDLIERLELRRDENLIIHAGDALAFDWKAVLKAPPYVFVANLPYNISSQILFKLLDHREFIDRAVLMFQKEVGARICADPGTRDYGILSVLCQMYYSVKPVVVIPAGAFRPPPKVDSIVVFFKRRDKPCYPIADELFFRRIVKAAFAQRRKTLRNTMKVTGFSREQIEAACLSNHIDPSRRGETLSLAEFAGLANDLDILTSDKGDCNA
ncbi:MAG: ribosomal RNA small subunit methyltransferase A [Desulfuromonas sp.]|nr:MAG: ribosomal RNA small subunit methyltransferase A [Desulfuromonas sp.]